MKVSAEADTVFVINISNMYLNTPLQEYQYMQFNISMVPQEMIDHYDLQSKVTGDGWLYWKKRKAIYGLKESEKLANIEPQTVLASEGYKPCHFTHGLYKQEKRNISFSLVVDDFGVRYIDKQDADHLITTLQKKYPIKMKWVGDYYLGMTLEWDYNKIHSKQNVQLSMPGYVKEALIKFKHHFVKQ